MLYKAPCASQLPPVGAQLVASAGQWAEAEVMHVLPGGGREEQRCWPILVPCPCELQGHELQVEKPQGGKGPQATSDRVQEVRVHWSCWISGGALRQEVNHHYMQNSSLKKLTWDFRDSQKAKKSKEGVLST